MDHEIIELTKALAWPTAISFWLYTFKPELTSILKNVGSLVGKAKSLDVSHGGTTLSIKEVEQELKEAVKIAEKETRNTSLAASTITGVKAESPDLNKRLTSLGMQTSPSNFEIDYYRSLGDKDVALAMSALRRDLEIILNNICRAYGLVRGRINTVAFTRKLGEEGALDEDQASLIIKLYNITSSVIHGETLSVEQKEMVFEIAQFLQKQFVMWLNMHFPNVSTKPS
jgi:hypothetical protein